MTYEEKRELRLQISQMLSDAGLNQKTIKEMVEEEIKNKVERAVDQCLNSLNVQCGSGDYISEKIRNFLSNLLDNTYLNREAFNKAVKEELKNKVIQVVLKDCEKDG